MAIREGSVGGRRWKSSEGCALGGICQSAPAYIRESGEVRQLTRRSNNPGEESTMGESVAEFVLYRPG